MDMNIIKFLVLPFVFFFFFPLPPIKVVMKLIIIVKYRGSTKHTNKNSQNGIYK